MKKFIGLPIIVLAACSLVFPQDIISTKDVCLNEDVEAIKKVFEEMSKENGSDFNIDPSKVKVYGNCDSIDLHYEILIVPVKLAKIQKKDECEVDIQYTETVKSMAPLTDTTISVCPEQIVALATIPSHGILFQYRSGNGFHLSVRENKQAAWAALEIRDTRGRLLHKNLKPFNGEALEFDWRPATGIHSPHFFSVSLGQGNEIIQKTAGSFF